MTKPLSLKDFRAIRIVLEPDDFALGPDEEVPPSDLIDKETWHNIVDLPDDVSVTTSNHRGKLLKKLNQLNIAWILSMDSAGEYGGDPISDSILDAHFEFESAIFNALHGYYKQAISSLRNALEIVIIGTYCHINKKLDLYAIWHSGNEPIKFGEACNGLWNASLLKPINSKLKSKLKDGIFDNKQGAYPGGWVIRLYNQLSNYSHPRPKYNNADLWESNGPIYSSQAFNLFADLYFQTLVLCYFLVKLCRPNFILPKAALKLFSIGKEPWTNLANSVHNYLYSQNID